MIVGCLGVDLVTDPVAQLTEDADDSRRIEPVALERGLRVDLATRAPEKFATYR